MKKIIILILILCAIGMSVAYYGEGEYGSENYGIGDYSEYEECCAHKYGNGNYGN